MLSNPSGKEISVDFNTVEGTASAGIDYTASAGTLTFAPGEISKTITVDILGDNLDEIDEAFTIELANPNNVTLSNNLATGTIIDNDLPPEISIENIEVTEGDNSTSNATITINLDRPSSLPISVDYATEDNTAAAGSDYNAIAGTVDFAPGETTKTIEVAVLGDKLDELDEAFTIHLSNPRGADILNNHGTGTIVNDDNPPTVSVENLTIAEGDSGTTEAIFTVSLSEASGKEITIDYSTVDGDAVAGIDYETESGTLTFAPGETSKTIAVTVNGDNLDELDEAFFLQIENGVNVAIDLTQITGTIVDDDRPPAVVINDITVTEGTNGTSTAIFTVTLDNPSSKEITFDYATADGTAISGQDYIATNGTLTFAPGETTKAIAVTIQGDNLDELDEAFFLNFDNASNATLAHTQGKITIADDDNPPEISISDITVTEGDSDATIATVTVTLDNPSSLPITVDYTTADNTANAGTDYTATNGTLIFAPGETSKTISVTVNGDNLDEIDESFSINLDNAANAVIGDNLATVTILDNDNPPELTVDNITVTEGNDGTSTAIFTVTLDNPSSKEISLDYATADGTAIAGSDYIATNGTLTFAPGETSAAIAVAIQGDTLDELDEAFTLNFTNPSNVTLVNTQGTVTITDDDDAPEIALTDISVTEGDSGSTTATVTVTLDAPSSLPITVDYATADGTAVAGSDYIAQNGTIAFAPGETAKTISVVVMGDSIDELDESFNVNLTNPSNGVIVDGEGTATIVNDDVTPELSVADISVVEGNNGKSTAVFTVNLNNPSSKEITLDYATADGTATSGEDYTAIAGALIFAPGETTKTIEIEVIGDVIDEIDEAFALNFSNENNVTLNNSQATANIIDDDLAPEVAIADISITESDSDTTTATLTVNLNNPSSKEISIDYSTVDGTAEAGIDYITIAGTLTFAPGETSKTIEVEVIGDIIDEIDEAFSVNFSNGSNVSVLDSETTVTIVDNDLPPEMSIDDVTVTEGDNGNTTATFTVSLNSPSRKEITADYSTVDGSAIAGEDYQAIAGRLTFAPGETSKTIAVDVIRDNIDEIDEAFAVSLNNASNAVVVQSPGTANIIDNDLPPALSVDDVVITETDEGTANAVFTVTLNNPSSQPVTVDYTTTDGTAIAGEDYTATNGTLTFAPGETSKTVSVSVMGDRLDELDKEFSLDLSNAELATIADHSGLGTIIDNDLPPEVIVESVTVMEGEIGTKEAQFVVNLNAPSNLPITVDYATADGTAIAGEDYLATSGTIFFAPGETSKVISVSVIGDRLDELNEAFDLNLSNITNATPNSFTATGTIADDDLPPQISINSVTVEEGDSNPVNAIFTVSLDAPSNLPITFEYSTVDNTASAADGDYLAVNGTITFNPGETSKNIVVPVGGDSINENEETFSVNLANPTNAIFATNQGTGTIEDNDNSAELAIEDVSVTEGDDGITTARFTVNLSQAVESTVTVEYATADGSAIAGEDYTAANGTLNFAPGETSKTIEVNVIGDTADEVDEIFSVNLNNVSSTTEVLIADGTGQGTIVDNDSLINEPEGILLAEGSDFEVEYVQPLTVPSASSVITIDYSELNFDTTDTDSINDALEFALVDESGKSLIHTIGSNQTAFFNLTEGEAAQIAPGVTLDGETIKVNLTDVLPGTTANLIARLVNNDGDVNTSVRIDTIFIESGDETIPVSIPDTVAVVDNLEVVNFDSLKDVTPSVSTQYQQTSFNQETQTLTANLALENQGTYWLDTPLMVAVTNISDSSIRIVGADGITPDGLSYYDFSNLVEGDRFAPGASSEATEIAFYNPNGVQFTYELVVLSELNTAPKITSNPDLEVIGGQSYSYRVKANDINNDALTYRLLAAPGNMGIDETTGSITWDTTTDDISNHAVVVEVSDGRGGVDLQTFNLAVIATPANRPPQFTSTPVVDAYINQPYEYDANAVDPDGDGVRYDVIGGPDGLTINPDTGEVEWTSPSVVVLGDTVIGQINLPGEVDEFSFSGSEGQQIYFDPLQYTGKYDSWNFNVYAPSGEQIVDTDLRYQNNQLVKLTETGNYRVVVSTTSNQTGSYGFSVIDLKLTPIAPLDTVIEGKLSPGSEDDIYRFAGNEGQRIYIDKISSSNNSVHWVLYDPQNAEVDSKSSMGDMELILPADGEYKLALRGQAAFTNTIDYSFEIITPDEITTPMELGSIDSSRSVYGEITEKGERDIYTFDAIAGQRILFDRLFFNSTYYQSHSINIISPSGQAVWNRNFNNGDDTKPIILLESGLYQVRVDATGENTGTYSFNLLDFDQATAIELDTKYAQTFEPGREAHIYKFEGTGGQRLFIDAIEATGGAWRLYDSNLQEVKNASNTDMELVLSKSDTYFLLVQGSSNNPKTYSFEVITPDEVVTSMELGSIDSPKTVSGEITEKGERDIYIFEGTIGQQLYFDRIAVNSNNTHTISLIDPRGESVWSRDLNDDDQLTPILLSQSGTYQIQIDANGENTGIYSFNLLDFNQANPIDFDTQYTGVLDPNRETHLYQFDGIEGQRLYLDSIESSSKISWTLYDPAKDKIEDVSFTNDIELVLANTGTYTLALRGQGGNSPIDYSFSVVDPKSITQELTLDTAVEGSISQKGERDIYTFAGDRGQKLLLDTLIDNTDIKATLIDPQGNQILDNISLAADDARHPLILPLAGDYRLVIDGSGETTADYNFQLHDLNSADELDISLPITGSINPGSEINVYKLIGYEGQRLYFQSSSNNDSTPNWLLYSPGNVELADKALNEDFEVVFNSDESYYLIIRGDGNLTDIYDYEIQVVNTTANPVAQPLTLNTLHNNNIGQVGQQNVYTFDGTVGQQIYLNANSSEEFIAKIYAPNGKEIFNGNLASDSSNLILTESGSYQVVIDGVAAATGDYDFRLANIADADVLPTDSAVTGTIAAGETKLYRLDGSAGDKLELVTQSLSSDADWVLYAPEEKTNGSTVISSAGIDSDLTAFLPREGRYDNVYTLAIRNNSDAAIDYGFTATVTAAPSVVNSGLGEVISGTYGVGETVEHTFTASAGTRIVLDGLATSNNVRTALIAPDGTEIFSNHNTQGDTEIYLLEQSGEYTVEVYDRYNNASRSYQFQVLDFASAEGIEFGEVISGNFGTDNRQTNLYRFSGNEREKVFVNLLSGGSRYNGNKWELYTSTGIQLDSNGRVIFDADANKDQLVSLTATGTYTLNFDAVGEAVGSYGFRIFDWQDAAQPINLDEVINGDFGEGKRETNLYRFSGNEGDRVFLNLLSGGNKNNGNKWELYTSEGIELISKTFSNNSSADFELNLPYTGEYILSLKGNGYNINTYSFELVSNEWSTTSYTIGETVTGEDLFLDEPGDRNSYTLEGTAGQRLYFDALESPSTSIDWKLTDPNGRVVFNLDANKDQLVNLTETGTYTLNFDAVGEAIGSYGFRTLDIADAITIDLDTVIAGDFGDSTRETQIYRFTANEGQPLYFDRTVGYQYNYYSLYDVNGLNISSSGFNSDLELDKLPRDGEYLLVLTGQGYTGNNNNYSLEIVTPEITTTLYTLGKIVETEISEAGEKDYYTFSGTKGQKLLFDNLGTANNTSFQLFAPSGRKVLNGTLNNTDYWDNLDETGTYTLVVDGSVDTTNSYSFRLSDYQEIATGIELDTTISGNFGTSKRETHVYAFEGDEGQYLYFDRTAGYQYNYWRIYDERNNLVKTQQLNSDFELALPHTGKYTLHLSGYGNSNSGYSFQIVTPELNTNPYTIGETIVSNIGEAGENDTYIFAGETGQRLLFDNLDYASNINWQLLSPSGERIFGTNEYYAISSDRTHLLSETGTYTLTVDGTGEATGNYGFQIQDWSNATSIELNTIVSEDLGDGRETDIYQFTAAKDKDTNLFFDRIVGDSNDRWSLHDSQGNVVSDYQLSSDFELTLPENDTYTLHVTGRNSTDNEYSFKVNAFESIKSNLNLSELVSGTISAAGEQDIYTFDGRIGQRLFFDAIDGDSSITSKLYSPSNKLIYDDGTDLDSSLFTLTENGSYRLVIDGNNTATGDYSFNLQELDAADSLDLATTISDSLDSGKEVKLYQFKGTQGTVLDFNLNAETWSGASWKLYDPGNQIIANPISSSPDFSATLPTNGTYTLAIIGNGTEAFDYSFEVIDSTPNSVFNTGFNTTYSGTLAAGEVIDHVFTGTAGTQVYLDNLGTSTWQVRMRLVAPDGSYVFNNHQLNTDKEAIILPQSGEYSLRTYGYNSYTTGSYNFQLLELPQNLTNNTTQSLALGTVTSGILDGLEAKVYSFDGKIGQQILFNGINGTNVGTKLIAPNGAEVFSLGNYRTTNDKVRTLTQSGIYHLIIRGEQATAQDYDFQLLDLNFGSSLQFNQTISGSLTDGRENQIYSFTGKAGETIGIDFISGSTDITAKLYAPGNHAIIKNNYLSSGYDYSLELPSDGTYTLLVEGGTKANAINYSFRAYNLTLGQKSNVITPGTGENVNGDGSLGIFPITLGAKDEYGGLGIQEYNIRLLPDPDNAAPAIISLPDELYNLDQGAYRYQIDAIDPDNDALSYSLIDSPVGAIINSDTGELIWVPESVVVGNKYDFTVEVTDGRGGVDRQTFTVEVRDKLGTIQGFVFEDLNANGIADNSLLNGDQPDTFFVIDTSGSMGGSSVNWLTADLSELTQKNLSPLDQELGTIITLAEIAIEQGRGDEVRLGIAGATGVTDMNPFEPGIQVITEANADYNDNGILDIREVIALGVVGNGSDTEGIRTAWDLHRSLGGDPNIIFMSDGFIGVNEQLIADAKADGVNIGAFGFAEGGMNTMLRVDPDAIYVKSFQDIADVLNGFDIRFIGEPLMEGVTVYLDLNNNEVLDADEPSQVSRKSEQLAASLLGNSDNNFYFTFDNLLPGTYTVRQITPNGFIQTAPEDSFIDTITIGGGETYTHLFGNHKVEPVPNSNPVFTSLAPTEGLSIGNLFRYQATATDPDANFLSYELTLAPEGMSVDSETGTILWQPTENQTGKAKAILRVNDGEGGADIQYFELSVADPNTLPVFTSSLSDNISPQVGKPFQYQAVAVDADLDPVTYELTGSNPSGVSVDPDTGLVTWQPASNQLGAEEITIKAIDDKGGEAIQTIELNVIEAQTNRAPDITSTPRNNVRIGTNYFYQPIASDPDGNPLSFNLLSAPEGMVMDDAGRVVWSPSGSQFGVHSVEIEVTDGQGGRAVQSFEIAATNRDSNSLPSITSVPDTRTNIEKLYTYQATATDPDGDLLLWILDKAPSGMVIDQNTGSISWQPGADQVGTHTVAVKVVDALGAFVGQEFTLTVTGVNTPASIVSTPVTNGSANQPYTYQVVGTDAENDGVSFGLGVHPEGMVIDPDTGVINWTPPVGGSYEIEVLVFDSQGGSNKQVFTIEIESETIDPTPTITTTPTIVEGNTAPVIISTPVGDGKVGQPYSYQITATDAENDNLLYGFASRPETMSIDPDTGKITWTPAVGGNYDISVLVFDEHGARTSQEFTVDVEALPPNTAPTITSSPSQIADVETTYSYQVVGEDKEGDVLNYELIAAPDGMTIDAATGAVTWASPVLGQHQVVVEVNDGKAGVAQGYTLTVKQNQAPVVNFSNPPAPTAIPGEVYSYDVPAYDPNGDRLTFTIDSVSLDKGFTIDELGRLRWTPEASDAGNHPVTITIKDEAGAEIEQSFTVEVVADTEAPKIDLYPGNIFVVNGEYQTDINSTVTFQAWATDNVGVTGVQLLVNGVPVAVDRDGIADVTFDELGTVELTAIALDAAGNIGEATATVDVYDFSDVDAPNVDIDLSGIEDNIVTAPVDIIGTIDDDNLDYYVVEIGHADGEGEFVELHRSSTPVTDGVIATFDPSTVANDAYSLRVTAFDNGGNFASSEETVYVEGELKLGNFQLSFTDLTVPVAGIPISVTRTYDTLTAGSQDDFGYGWRLEFRDTNLRTSVGEDENFEIFDITSKGFREGDAVYITLPGGKRETFLFKPQLTPVGRMLAALGGGSGLGATGQDFGLYEPVFVSESDSNNKLEVNEATLIRSESGQFTGVAGVLYNPADPYYGGKYTLTTGSGIEYEIDAVSGDLRTATDTNGNKLTFTESGITSDSGVSVTFGRDGQGRITSVIDPDGNEIKYQYDDNGDLISVTDREENTTRYGYSEERSHYLDEIIDPLGRPAVKSEYDEQGRLKKIIDTDGDPIEFIYDPENSIQITKDALGNPTVHEYDEFGNVIREANALGHETLLEYDDNNNVTKVTDPNGNITEYTYDDRGNVLSRTALHHPDDPNPEVTRYTYNKYGQNTSVILPTGAVFNQNYDGYGNLLSMTDGDGNIIQAFTYDNKGNVTSETDSTGTSYYSDFDSFGNARRVEDSFRDVITSTYDSKGNITSFTDDEGTSTFTYDDSGREIRADYGDGVYVEYGYEGAGSDWTVLEAPTIGRIERKFTDDGKLGGWVTPGGEELTFTYDDAGRLKTEVTPDGTTTYEYDKLGRVVRVTNSNSGLITQMHYDEIVGEDPDLGVADNLVGKLAARTVIVDENTSYTTSYTYYADGRTKTVTDANNNTWFYEYNGTSTTITDPLGRTTTSVQTDQYLPSETIYADGTSSKVEYLYDNNLQEATDYPTIVTDRGGNDRHFGYDEFGRLTSATDLGDTSYDYVYGESGLAAVQSPTGGNVLAYTYDEDGNVTSVTYSDGGVKEYTYNDDGNVTRVSLPDGVTIDYQYDEDGIEISRTSSIDGQVFTSYDPDGRLLSIEDTAGTTEYVYDESTGEFEGINYGSGANLRYEYDDFGRITQVSVQADALSDTYSTSYEYDALGNLTKVTDPNGGETVMVYDGVGRLTSRSLPNGVTSSYSHIENTDWIEKITHTASDGTVLVSTEYIRGASGEPVKIIREDGSYTEVAYDSSLRVVKEAYFGADGIETESIEYSYDADGNRLNVSNGDAEGTYNYDNIHQLTDITTATGTETYTYDEGGRIASITRDGETWNLEYNTADLITKITDADGNVVVEYEYDSAGRRIEANDAAGNRDYLVAPIGNTDLESPHLVTDENGDLISAYVYGGAMPLMRLDENGNPVYYLTDAMGSVIGLADGSGIEVADFRYDSFGNLRSSTGIEGDREELAGGDFRFQGQWLESTTDLYHFRARYYDPESGRFVSRDPVELIEYEPESSNPYQFVYNNPHIYSDPTGEFTISELNASRSLENALAGMRRYVGAQAKDYVLERLGDSLSNVVLSVFNNFLPTSPIGGTLLDLVFDDNEGGIGGLFDSEFGDLMCEHFQTTPLINNLWFEVRINSAGTPQNNGIICGNRHGNSNSRIGRRSQNQPGSRPDFMFRNTPPTQARINRKSSGAYLVGDFKLAEVKAYNSVLGRDTQKSYNQWIRMTKYARKYQMIPFVSYVSLFESSPGNTGVSGTLRRKAAKEAMKKGVILVIANLID